MSVKRPYTSQLRAEQARVTRRAIVSAAARLFVKDGFGRTTVDAIAAEAGVSRKTVFTAVGGKVEMLKLALDWAVVGDDEPVPLAERAEIHQLAGETDPVAILRGWVDIVTSIAARVAGLSGALTVAAGLDPDARALWERGQAQRLEGARAFIAHLSAHTDLRPGLTLAEAADIAWLHSDPALYNRLVLQRGWSNRRFEAWLHETMTLQLLD
ncbi:MAG TPA: helix-turn-helix domain-containing protein [Nakamurella sp.]